MQYEKSFHWGGIAGRRMENPRSLARRSAKYDKIPNGGMRESDLCCLHLQCLVTLVV